MKSLKKANPMARALFLGILGSFFFAFTFILNRSMSLGGGFWGWSGVLRYVFTLILLFIILLPKNKAKPVYASIKSAPGKWLLWSTVGFGLFYAPLTLGSSFGESWFTAAAFQFTIVCGVLLSPLFGKKIPKKQLIWGFVILVGIFVMQMRPGGLDIKESLMALIPILIGAFAFPLGNRKMMQLIQGKLTTLQRIYGMTICSMPFWILLGIYSFIRVGLPEFGQVSQSFFVALLSGVVATTLFFQATELVRDNASHLAIIEATQCGGVVFTLLLGVVVLSDPLPSLWGFVGIALIIVGMVFNSLSAE